MGKATDSLHWNLQRAFHGSRILEGIFARQRVRMDAASARQRRGSGWQDAVGWIAVAALCAVYLLVSACILLWAGGL